MTLFFTDCFVRSQTCFSLMNLSKDLKLSRHLEIIQSQGLRSSVLVLCTEKLISSFFVLLDTERKVIVVSFQVGLADHHCRFTILKGTLLPQLSVSFNGSSLTYFVRLHFISFDYLYSKSSSFYLMLGFISNVLFTISSKDKSNESSVSCFRFPQLVQVQLQ